MARRNRSRRSSPKTLARRTKKTKHKQALAALLDWFLPDGSIFANLKFHGNTAWSPVDLVRLAVFWVWSGARNVTDGFAEAAEFCQRMSGASPLGTYQGFMGALVTWSSPFIDLLCRRLHERMEQLGGKFWRVGEWVAIAFDGSRGTAPRSQSNEEAFCAPRHGTGKKSKYGKYGTRKKGSQRKDRPKDKPQPPEPQAWITMLWHMGLRLPWLWRLGPSNSSERAHVMEMIKAGCFPLNTLFCGDAGFIGYLLWLAITQIGAHFLVRVGANVHLLMENMDCVFQEGDIVLCWPKDMKSSGMPPLRLRLVQVMIGNTRVWLLTSVLDAEKLSIKQMVRLYKMRWGVEVEFRGLKQTLDCAKLCCRNSRRLLAELDWSIMAMALAELLALKEQLAMRQAKTRRRDSAPDPAKRSLANTMRAIRYTLRHVDDVVLPGQDLPTLLRRAVTDSYRRKASKCARYRPPNPDKKPLGDPKLRPLTAEERKALALLPQRNAA